MRVHQEYNVTGEWSRRLALLITLVNSIDDIVADYECNTVYLCEPLSIHELLGGSIRLCGSECKEVPEKVGRLDEAIRYELISDYKIELSSAYGNAVTQEEIYSYIFKEFENMLDYLDSYLLRTYLEGTEYMVVVLRSGHALLLEGERNKVLIPAKGIVASAHTHPRGCMPSPHDIRSLIHMFFEGGIGMGIKSKDCTLRIIRFGPFTENDYVELSLFRDLLRRGDFKKVKKYFESGVIGDNVKVIVSY